MKTRLLLLASLLLSCLHPATAADVAGAKDPPGLKRYEGTRITYYSQKAYDAYELPLGKMISIDFATHKGKFEKSLKLEGKVTRISYASRDANRTSLEVFRNYATELAAQGWETLWEGSEDDLSKGNGDQFASLFADRPGQTFEYSFLGGRFLAAQKGSTHLALYVVNFHDGYVGSNENLVPTKGAPVIALDIIQTAGMDEKMVPVKASEMASKIDQQGSVNLYGFYFDFNSAALQNESSPTVDEVVKLLQSDPGMRLLVVGHTDAVGTFDYNIDLSRKRAASVVSAITQQFPSAAGRLTPCGVGFQCPVASNSDDAGRAKNRRVALVKVDR